MVRTQQAAAVRSAGACDAPHEGEQHARVGVCRYGHMCVRIHTTRGRVADTRGCRFPRECARRPACGQTSERRTAATHHAHATHVCMRHLARRMLHAAWRSLRCYRMLCWMVAPERLVGTAEQRARFEQLAPPQQLLRFAVQQLRLQLNRAACAAKPPPACGPWRGQLRSGPAARTRSARGDIAGAARACMRVRRMGALPCMRARACLNACTRRRMHARA